MPLSPPRKKSPFDIPKPQKTPELLTLDLEIQLVSCQSRLDARKRLLWANIKALARYDTERKETNEERLERLVNKRDCLNWIAKHRNAIECIQRRMLQIEKKLKSLKSPPKRKKIGMRKPFLGKFPSASWPCALR